MTYAIYTAAAIQAALKAGALLEKGFGTSFQVSSKEGKQNLVTEYDHAAEKIIIDYISSLFPTHSFLGEESGLFTTHPEEVLWVIDPLDGTVNFAHNFPMFAVSIAATLNNEIVSGVIFQPIARELYVAEKGGGAFLNGSQIHVSATDSLELGLHSTGFSYNMHENHMHCIDHPAHMSRKGFLIRELGSAAMQLAYIAAGRLDSFWHVELHPWDIAAGKLLVEEAGGRISCYDGAPYDLYSRADFLATNGLIHNAMREELLSVF